MKYHKIITQYREYLNTLNYSDIVCYNSPNQIHHFLLYSNVRVQRISKKHVDEFIQHLQTSISKRTKRKRTNIHINSYIISLKRFSTFLLHIHNLNVSTEHLTYLENDSKQKTILTTDEIKRLFEVCDNTKVGLRDKAMLSLYYSCGLRRNEALHVEINDIDFTSNILFVRKGKGNKQRYVPFTQHTHHILRNYINIGRRRLNKKHKLRKTLLISNRGERIQSQSLFKRLKVLCKKAMIDKNIGLHSLRHSIATHLLEQNMSIYDISQFLGHSSLQSTQIYTHIYHQ